MSDRLRRGTDRRPLGVVTRGTTNPNRLRRVDNWIAVTLGAAAARRADPLVVDLGYGASRSPRSSCGPGWRGSAPDVRVVGLEIDPARVAAARPPPTRRG